MLGSVFGHDDDFIGRQLHRKRVEPDRLLDRNPLLDDLQAAWFLLQNCEAPRANFCCAFLPPHLTAGYAAAHDSDVASELLEQGDMSFPPTSLHAAQRGLGSAPRVTTAMPHIGRAGRTRCLSSMHVHAAATRLLQALRGDAALPPLPPQSSCNHICDKPATITAWVAR